MQNRDSRKRKSYRRKGRQLLRYACVIVAILGLSYLYVWQRVYSLKLSEERATRQRLVKELEEKCRAQSFEIAELSSMQRIEEIAAKKFGMSPLSESQVISYPSYRERRSGARAQAASNVSRVNARQSETAHAGEKK